MNGAESLVRTLVAGGVDVCFTNPGTSEMHFVAALDRVEGMRCVLGLFEGVVTGAADGYYRMKGTPASTLLHLGPGLANGLANLHNAKKANSGIVNIVGQHATYHIGYNAPLTSDIEGWRGRCRPGCGPHRMRRPLPPTAPLRSPRPRARRPQIATLILPADTAWNEADGIRRLRRKASAPVIPRRPWTTPPRCAQRRRADAAAAHRQRAHRARAGAGAQIAGKTGCKVMGQTYNPRMARGKGRFAIDRIPYVIEQALPILKDFKNIVLVEANDPRGVLRLSEQAEHAQAQGCEVHRMTSGAENSVAALEALAGALTRQPADRSRRRWSKSPKPTGALTHASIAQAIAMAIRKTPSWSMNPVTTGRGFFPPTAAAAPHDWLQNMGGSIGFSTPVATGAAWRARTAR
jgi:acetolactate synthase-1/2/3 large subunit